jgi:hypothetical protein
MKLYTRRAPNTFEPADVWRGRAACRAVAPDLMFPDNDAVLINEARRICKDCPVRLECLTDAFAVGEVHGVRGGTSPRDRKRIAERVERGASLTDELRRAALPRELDLGKELDKRTEDGPDGHTRWLLRSTTLCLGGRIYTPMQLAFTVGYDRPPVGTVRAACGVVGCVTPDHLTDEQMRGGRRTKRARVRVQDAV